MRGVINISSILIKTVSGINPFNYQLMKYKVIYLTGTFEGGLLVGIKQGSPMSEPFNFCQI